MLTVRKCRMVWDNKLHFSFSKKIVAVLKNQPHNMQPIAFFTNIPLSNNPPPKAITPKHVSTITSAPKQIPTKLRNNSVFIIIPSFSIEMLSWSLEHSAGKHILFPLIGNTHIRSRWKMPRICLTHLSWQSLTWTIAWIDYQEGPFPVHMTFLSFENPLFRPYHYEILLCEQTEGFFRPENMLHSPFLPTKYGLFLSFKRSINSHFLIPFMVADMHLYLLDLLIYLNVYFHLCHLPLLIM